ncbi:MAG: PilZ domain-containing protein [Nitrospirae bacterium]|nr:PilZ domain-containing protein [Nitrospirota bacterium]
MTVKMAIEFRRRYKRQYYVVFVRYYLNVFDENRLKKVQGIGVSVDISAKGIGLITQYPLEVGSFLLFEDGNIINNITAKASVVRWAEEIEDKTYRVGLEFVD